MEITSFDPRDLKMCHVATLSDLGYRTKVTVANAPPAGWKPEKFTDMRTFNIEMEAKAPVADVATFYRETLLKHGFSIVSDTRSQDWAFGLEARSADRTHQVYVNVLKRSNDTFIRLTDHYTIPRP